MKRGATARTLNHQVDNNCRNVISVITCRAKITPEYKRKKS